MAEDSIEQPGTDQPAEPKAEQISTVPIHALTEQRAMNRELKEELKAAKEAQQRMEDTFQKLLSNLNEKPAPKYEDDPLGHVANRSEVLERELKSVREELQTINKQAGQNQFLQQVSEASASAEAEFRLAHPDYDAALKYLKEVTRSDLADQGMTAAEIERTVNAGKVGLAHAALQQGKNPAQVIYERAKRYGFKAAAAAGDEIKRLANAGEMAKTVDGGQGAGLTLAGLSQLPDDQVNEIIKDDKKWNALIRGGMVR